MVLSFLAKKLAAQGGLSHGFMVRSLAVVIFANVAYRISVPPPADTLKQQQQQQQQHNQQQQEPTQ